MPKTKRCKILCKCIRYKVKVYYAFVKLYVTFNKLLILKITKGKYIAVTSLLGMPLKKVYPGS